MFNLFQTEPDSYPPLLPLEAKIFEAAGTPELLQGLLYICPLLFKDKLFMRYIATGVYRTLIPQIIKLIQDKAGVREGQIFPWEVYTEKDLTLHGQNIKLSGGETTYKRKVGCQDSSKSNKKCVLSLLHSIKAQLDQIYCIVFIHKAKANPAQPTHR